MTTINVTTTGQTIRVLFPIYLLHLIIEPVVLSTRLPRFFLCVCVCVGGGELTGVLSNCLDDNSVGIRFYQREFRRGIFVSSRSDVCIAQQDEEGEVFETEFKFLSNTVS
jgi:hypothetical protein